MILCLGHLFNVRTTHDIDIFRRNMPKFIKRISPVHEPEWFLCPKSSDEHFVTILQHNIGPRELCSERKRGEGCNFRLRDGGQQRELDR